MDSDNNYGYQTPPRNVRVPDRPPPLKRQKGTMKICHQCGSFRHSSNTCDNKNKTNPVARRLSFSD